MRARAALAGWIERLRPNCPDAVPSPLRRSSSGEPMAPQASTTTSARTRSVPPPAVAATTSVIRSPRRTRSRTRAPVKSTAPASHARGTNVTPVCCFAPAGQPNAHTPEPTQPRALRRRKPPENPSASTPRRTIAAFSPANSAGTSATPIVSSTSSKTGVSSSSVNSVSPSCVRHRCRTCAGVRKQVPLLMSVVPPTPLPVGSMIGGSPIVALWPPSRYKRAAISRGRAVNVSASCQAPSSSIATRRPADASSAAAGAPPAPVPTTHASTVTIRSEVRVAAIGFALYWFGSSAQTCSGSSRSTRASSGRGAAAPSWPSSPSRACASRCSRATGTDADTLTARPRVTTRCAATAARSPRSATRRSSCPSAAGSAARPRQLRHLLSHAGHVLETVAHARRAGPVRRARLEPRSSRTLETNGVPRSRPSWPAERGDRPPRGVAALGLCGGYLRRDVRGCRGSGVCTATAARPAPSGTSA